MLPRWRLQPAPYNKSVSSQCLLNSSLSFSSPLQNLFAPSLSARLCQLDCRKTHLGLLMPENYSLPNVRWKFPIQQPLGLSKAGEANRRPAQARETERDPRSGIISRTLERYELCSLARLMSTEEPIFDVFFVYF